MYADSIRYSMKGSTFFERNAQVTYAVLHFIHTEIYQILNAKYSKMELGCIS